MRSPVLSRLRRGCHETNLVRHRCSQLGWILPSPFLRVAAQHMLRCGMPCMGRAAVHAWKLWYMQQRALPYGTGAKSCLEAAPAPCPAVSAASKPAHAGRAVGHAGRAIGHAGSTGHAGRAIGHAGPTGHAVPACRLFFRERHGSGKLTWQIYFLRLRHAIVY